MKNWHIVIALIVLFVLSGLIPRCDKKTSLEEKPVYWHTATTITVGNNKYTVHGVVFMKPFQKRSCFVIYPDEYDRVHVLAVIDSHKDEGEYLLTHQGKSISFSGGQMLFYKNGEINFTKTIPSSIFEMPIFADEEPFCFRIIDSMLEEFVLTEVIIHDRANTEH
jgi:hypothetical protein